MIHFTRKTTANVAAFSRTAVRATALAIAFSGAGLMGCDPAPGDDDDAFCVDPEAEQTEPLLDNAQCVLNDGTIIAACRAADGLFRNCDLAWIEECEANGGDADPCHADTLPGILPMCGSTAHLQPACDAAFMDACDREESYFTCSGPACISAACIPPADPDPIFEACCAADACDSDVCDSGSCTEVEDNDDCSASGQIAANCTFVFGNAFCHTD
jgi:hypothetical protein